jgi:hypothetical protein
LPAVQGVRLALYGRNGLGAAGQALLSQLLDLCASNPR